MVIQGSRSTVSKTFNYILAKYHLTHMMFYKEYVASIIYKIKNVICNETDHDTSQHLQEIYFLKENILNY